MLKRPAVACQVEVARRPLFLAGSIDYSELLVAAATASLRLPPWHHHPATVKVVAAAAAAINVVVIVVIMVIGILSFIPYEYLGGRTIQIPTIMNTAFITPSSAIITTTTPVIVAAAAPTTISLQATRK